MSVFNDNLFYQWVVAEKGITVKNFNNVTNEQWYELRQEFDQFMRDVAVSFNKGKIDFIKGGK